MEEPALAAAATPRAAWARALVARYDGAVMRVEPPAAVAWPVGPLSDAQQTTWRRLLAWCFAGAGDGRSPFWRPGVLPRVEQRFAVATLADGSDADRARLVEAFSRHLDGSDQLEAAGGAVAGLLLRLRVKRNDALWWRARQPSDPWDCGYLIGEPAALRRFQPRRATLMVADDSLPDAALREALHILQTRSAGFRHPVRLLVLGRGGDALAVGGLNPTPLPAPTTPPR
ncbi:MAG: hypothetical protein C4535_01955 [Comamonadaceae bacterium]|nr:MAG: hypothetical protein C4535_01955 [Comamonadaceae bacterium]